MMQRVCDRCGKEVTDIDTITDIAPIETPWMEIDAKFLKPDADYCTACQYKMRAEAGRLYWDNYKQQRKQQRKPKHEQSKG